MRERLPAALRMRDFALLWTSSLTNGIAGQMVAVAIGWQVYAIHHSPLDLGLVGLMEFLPLPLLALPAGHLADRSSRRLVVAAGTCMHMAIAAALLAITLAGARALWPFLAIGAAAGVMSAVTNPAGRALTPQIVPEDLLQGALALRSVASQIGIVTGPALGGVIFAIEPVAVYASAVGLIGVALAAVLALTPRPAPSTAAAAPTWDNLAAGARFILSTRMLLGLILLDLFAVLLGDPIALAPVFASSILHAGPIGLGALRTAPSVGALLAGLLIARRPLRLRAGPAMLGIIAVFGAGTIVFGVSKWLPLSLGALFVTGFVDMISVNIRQTAAAVITPLHLQGRVNAVEWVFISASNELGAFEAGAVASLIGTVRAVVLGGSLMIAVAASWTRLFPELSRMGPLADLRVGSAP
ncbi:MAG: MFS transporter [Actinobacteria bacterium]|nr:MFS transporter [Actinomycetota bacterium]